MNCRPPARRCSRAVRRRGLRHHWRAPRPQPLLWALRSCRQHPSHRSALGHSARMDGAGECVQQPSWRVQAMLQRGGRSALKMMRSGGAANTMGGGRMRSAQAQELWIRDDRRARGRVPLWRCGNAPISPYAKPDRLPRQALGHTRMRKRKAEKMVRSGRARHPAAAQRRGARQDRREARDEPPDAGARETLFGAF